LKKAPQAAGLLLYTHSSLKLCHLERNEIVGEADDFVQSKSLP
jgi:hypothetical protein